MRAEQILNKCRALVSQPADRVAYLQEVRSRTRGVSAYFSNYIPEEVIAAAGFHPLRIIGGYETSNGRGRPLYTPVCSFARAVFAAAQSGAFSFVSSVIFPNSCDSLKVLHQMWEDDPTLPPAHVLLHPVRMDDSSIRYFAQEIRKLADALQEESGLHFTDARLAETIQRYNQTRQWLRQVYACPDSGAPFLTGSDRIALVTSGMLMDRDEYSQLLRQVVTESLSAPSTTRAIGKRIMVIGPLVDRLDLLAAIERLGASIVADDVTNGSRYFDLDVDLAGDLYENLAKRYLRSGPSPTMNTDVRDDERLFRRRLTDLHPDGVIFINQKFCEPHVHNYLGKRSILAEMHVSALMLEAEYGATAVSERDLLRIESFIGMLGER